MDLSQPTLTVLTRQYSDGSGFEVVRVYEHEDRARQDFELVKNDVMWIWKLHDVPFFPTPED